MEFRDGTLQYDMALPRGGNFMGAAFHATTPENGEVVFFRPRLSGTPEAVQYAPALNGVAASWQIYHGDGANAVAAIPFETWVHVRLDVAGVTTRLYLNDDTAPVLVVPRLAGVAGMSVGVWTGFFGRGAYFSNIRVTARPPSPPGSTPSLPQGTIADWELSPVQDAEQLTPGRLPDLRALRWDRVHTEALGFVLVNRYRRTANAGIPVDATTGEPLVDSIMGNRVPGSKVVFARATIHYLPLRAGENELVFAVTEYTGGWAFWARLER